MPGGVKLADAVRALYEKKSDSNWYLSSGESEQCECKLEFDPKKLSGVLRAIAALANNKGGFIFFGVSNEKFRVEGLGSSFADTDVVQIVEKLKAHLSPTPSILAKEVVQIGDKSIGVLRVAKHLDAPVIVYRAAENLNEGEILFRYAGQSSRIKFGDLRAMLDARDRRAQLALASAAARVARVGTENALILDTGRNVLDAKGKAILIDEKLAESIKFIKEGQFDEKVGSPTLRLVGEVSPVSVGAITKVKVSREAIFQEGILDDFLHQVKVEHPVQYIHAGLAQSRIWLPIFYYVKLSGLSNKLVAEDVRQLKIAQKGKKKVLIERLLGQRTAFAKVVTRAAAKVAKDVSEGVVAVPTTVDEVTPFANGITGVSKTPVPLSTLLSALQKCRAIAEKADHSTAIGSVYKASCRVDEMFFQT